jgi:hypothetical protein
MPVKVYDGEGDELENFHDLTPFPKGSKTYSVLRPRNRPDKIGDHDIAAIGKQ